MFLSFIGLIVGMVCLQFLFVKYFALDYYTYIKADTMEEGYAVLVEGYDGTLKSIQESTQEYEWEHGISYIIVCNGELLYSSRTLEASQLDGYGVNIPERNPRESESEGKGFPKNPNIHIANEFQEEEAILQLQAEFLYEGETVACVMMLPMKTIQSSVTILAQSNMLIALVGVVMGIFLAVFLSKTITKPIREIEHVSVQLAELDFSQKANEDAPSTELSSLACSINKMSGKLEESIRELSQANEQLEEELDFHKKAEKMQRDFVGNVSHEMKTPLALLQLYAANLKSDIAGIDKEYYYDTMIEEAGRLSEMVSTMLTVSSVESGIYEMNKERFSYSELCNTLLMKMEPLLTEFQVLIQIESGMEIVGDAKYLEQAMKNYITNATHHTKPGDTIMIEARREENEIIFRVQNQGMQIEEEELEVIWNSFYRSDRARIRTNHNVGLGLSIVRTIITKHGGTCGAVNVEDGVSFFYRIPS